MAYFAPESTMSAFRQTNQIADQINHGFVLAHAHTLPPFGPRIPLGYMPDIQQYYYTPASNCQALVYAAPAFQHLAPAQASPQTRLQLGVRSANGVFVPTAMDLARGRINQAVYEARFKHDYTDNITKAKQARVLFDRHFGTDPKDLLAWQDMCFCCGSDLGDMPITIRACKKFLRIKYVNSFDFITAVDEFLSKTCQKETKEPVYKVDFPTFVDASKLEEYSRAKGLICPARIGRGNDLFRFMLAKWFQVQLASGVCDSGFEICGLHRTERQTNAHVKRIRYHGDQEQVDTSV